MSDSFGGRLRERREGLAIALATIAQHTKIKQSLLEGLERDDLSHWPAGIFRRAYVRSYAEAIGLNADVVLREFLAIHPDPAAIPPTEPLAPARSNGGRPHPPTRLSYLLGSAIGSFGGRRHLQPPSPPPAAEIIVPPAEKTPVVLGPTLERVAELCAAFGRMASLEDLESLLQESAALLRATGIIVWVWDESSAVLRPAVAAGYSARVLARLPAVHRDADNATAEAFRSARPRGMLGALAAPIVTAAGCSGVLAMEFAGSEEPTSSVQAAAAIIAAFLALLMAQTSTVEGESVGDYSSDRRASS